MTNPLRKLVEKWRSYEPPSFDPGGYYASKLYTLESCADELEEVLNRLSIEAEEVK